MAIKTVEIICIPCPKCKHLKQVVSDIIKDIGLRNKIKIVYDFQFIANTKNISQYGLGPSQAPVLIINGNVEGAGRIDNIALKNKLNGIHLY